MVDSCHWIRLDSEDEDTAPVDKQYAQERGAIVLEQECSSQLCTPQLVQDVGCKVVKDNAGKQRLDT